MASAFSSAAAVLSCASPHPISKSSLATSLFNCGCSNLIGPQFMALDAGPAFVACTLWKLKPYVRFIQRNDSVAACFSHVVARYTINRAYVGGDSGSTPDPEEGGGDDQGEQVGYVLQPNYESYDDGVEIAIEKIGRNQRRIRSKVAVQAGLQTVWNILTDYERLADFIPGLAVSQLLEKREKFARLFQVGEQNLAFGLKFNAKGTLDCFERDLQTFPLGQRRDIDFTMVDGDFQLFEGTWSVEQGITLDNGDIQINSVVGQEFQTTLHYVLHVKPKVWLPVHLVEGRLCNEIRKNLSCIREEAEKASRSSHSTLQ